MISCVTGALKLLYRHFSLKLILAFSVLQIALVSSAFAQFPPGPFIARTFAEVATSPIDVFGADVGHLDTNSLVIVKAPAHGSVVHEISLITGTPTRKLVYVPGTRYSGIDTFQYQICDTSSTPVCYIGTVTVTVLPRAGSDVYSTTVNRKKILSVLDNDKGDWDPSLLHVLSMPLLGGVVTFEADSSGQKTGKFIYTPPPNVSGIDEFSYTTCDRSNPSACDNADVSILIEPVALPDSAVTRAGIPTHQIEVLKNDTGSFSGSFPTISTEALNGRDTVKGHNIVYTPNPGFSGDDTLTYQICDGSGSCVTAPVYIKVLPLAVPDTLVVKMGDPGSIRVTANDKGIINMSSLKVIAPPSDGTAQVIAGGSVRYVSNKGYTGIDSLIYSICDKNDTSACSQAKVLIRIGPKAFADTAKTNLNTSLQIMELSNDVGHLDSGSVKILSACLNGSSSADTITGILTYKPKLDFSGTDSLVYKVCDTAGLCDTAHIFLNVLPKAIPDTLLTKAGISGIKQLTHNDKGSIDSSSVKIVRQALSGHAQLLAGGSVSYIPAAGFTGTDSIVYSVCNKGDTSACSQANLLIRVGPKAFPDTVNTLQNMAIQVNELRNDIGHLDSTGVSIAIAPSNGSTQTDSLSGKITYTPKKGFVGVDSLTYKVCDLNAALPCDSAKIFVLVGVPPADLKISKTAVGLPGGYLVAYTITIQNQGPDTALAVQVSDPLPPESTLLANSLIQNGPGSLSYDQSSNTINFSLEELAKDSVRILHYQLSFSKSGQFTNTATVKTLSFDQNMADNTASATIQIDLPAVKIPNVFTPNGDGINDNLVIDGIGAYPNNEIQIFNRWGSMVYHMNAYGTSALWNGSNLPEGTYYVILRLNDQGTTKTLSRYLTLIRTR